MNKLLIAGIATALLIAIMAVPVVGQSNQNIDDIPKIPSCEGEDKYCNNPFGGDGTIRTSCLLDPNNCGKLNLPRTFTQEVAPNTLKCREYTSAEAAQEAYDVLRRAYDALLSLEEDFEEQQGPGIRGIPLQIPYCVIENNMVCCDG